VDRAPNVVVDAPFCWAAHSRGEAVTRREYVFQDTEERREFDRLRSIETIFDPATRRRLLSAGIREGWRCLEVGPGAELRSGRGSWLSAQPSGRMCNSVVTVRIS